MCSCGKSTSNELSTSKKSEDISVKKRRVIKTATTNTNSGDSVKVLKRRGKVLKTS